MRILKLPAKILYYVSDEFNKIFKNDFLCVSIQIAARISTGKSDMAITHCWICYHFNINPRFPPFLLFVRCKSGRSFRDGYLLLILYHRFKRTERTEW